MYLAIPPHRYRGKRESNKDNLDYSEMMHGVLTTQEIISTIYTDIDTNDLDEKATVQLEDNNEWELLNEQINTIYNMFMVKR